MGQLLRASCRSLRVPFLALALALWLGGLSAPAAAESVLRFPMPAQFGKIEAGTYDEDGQRVGPASMRTERLPDGRIRLSIESGFDGAARTRALAILEPVENGSALRIVSQESRSLNQRGEPLGVLRIDHERGIGTCVPAPESGKSPKEFRLPEEERVANVPVTLLFHDLVTGDADRVDFQLFVCTGGPRVLDAHAEPADRNGDALVEVHYNVDLGPLISSLFRPFVPRMSVWFDRQDPTSWVGYRVPLYGRGPTVLVVRSGLSPERLLAP